MPANSGPSATIGIMDSGVNNSHPQLKDKVALSRSFTSAPAHDTSGHGTSVAIIAVAGLNAKVASARVTNEDNVPVLGAVLDAIDWFVENEISTVNMSFGFDVNHPGSEKICEAMNAAPSILFVAAKSNRKGGEHRVFPAHCTANNVLAVGTEQMNTGDGSVNSPLTPSSSREDYLRLNADHHLKSDDPAAATPFLREVLKLVPDDGVVAYTLAALAFQAGETPNARDYAMQATEHRPDLTAAFWVLALAEANLANRNAAIIALNHVISQGSGDYPAKELKAFLENPDNVLPDSLKTFFDER